MGWEWDELLDQVLLGRMDPWGASYVVGKHVLGGHTCEGVLALGADGEECWALHELEIKHLIKSPVFYNKQSMGEVQH